MVEVDRLKDQVAGLQLHIKWVETKLDQAERALRAVQPRSKSELEREVERLHNELQQIRPAMYELAHLTPGGSEFYNDPARCAQYIRDRYTASQERLKKVASERNSLREQLGLRAKVQYNRV